MQAMPRFSPGDIVRLERAASVQFAGNRATDFRIIREQEWSTYDGWVWLDGYQLNQAGNAVERRSVFVMRAGVTVVDASPAQSGRSSNAHRSSPGSRLPAMRPQRPASVGGRSVNASVR